ncbi:MAG TPA: redoxin domain-containing protein [Candidatus Hydrogenedens sp.]|nr:redoxin domain-containing protein [Candidatus Hydrogenedens sp.]
MYYRKHTFTFTLVILIILFPFSKVFTQTFVKNDKFPIFSGQDIRGEEVSLSKYSDKNERIIVLFLFSTKTGEEMATKLSILDLQYGGRKLEIIGIGCKDSEDNIKQFADRLDLKYKIVPEQKLSNNSWMNKIDILPMVLFIVPPDMFIERILRGGGHQLSLLKETAEFFYRKKDFDTANKILNSTVPNENTNVSQELRELKGYILSEQGKIDEAEKEFGAINAYAGLARLAYMKGDYQKAIEYADRVPNDGYAQTVKGMALSKLGKIEEAKTILENNLDKTKYDWMKAENLNAQGRISQEIGDDIKAIEDFEQAVSIDPLNVVALSNKAVVHEKKGELEKAKEVLTEASKRGSDQITQLLLQQVTEQIQKNNDAQRQKIIQEQITQLTDRFKELKASGAITEDTWDSKPPVIAFLKGNTNAQGILLDRAGVDIAFQRELEKTVRNRLSPMQVVEREMIDKLLQELQLGSSELASTETQRQLGKVLSAGILGFIEFTSLGKSPMVYVRLVDTETTEIIAQCSSVLNENDIISTIQKVVEEMEQSIRDKNKNVKGTIISVDGNTTTVNLGKSHGLKEGCILIVLQQGEPIEVSGKKIGFRQVPIGKIEIQEVENDYSTGKLTLTKQDTKIEKGMKVKGSIF